MMPMSKQCLDASINSFLQTIAELASKAASTEGKLADANFTIARLTKELEEAKQKIPAAEEPPQPAG